MALLSDLTGGSSVGAPDAGAVKLTSVFAGRGAYDYTPGTTIAAGKYALKCSANSRGILRFSGNGNQEVVFKNLSGVDVRGSENQAVIDLPNNATTLSMSFESFDRDPAPFQRPLPYFYPGTTNYTGTVTLNTSNTQSLYGSSNMFASDPTGKVQVSVGGYGAGIWASRDYGNTWHSVGNYNSLLYGTGNYTNETYSVEYFNGRFIIGGGPNTSYGMISNNGFDWEYSGDTNLAQVRTAAVGTTGYIFGRNATSNNVGFSPDGQSFTLFSPSGLIGNVTHVAWDGANYLAFDDGSRMAVSTDGINWGSAYSVPFICRGLQKLGATWWAISQAGQLYYSSNLTSWTSGSTLSSSTYYNHQLRKVGSTLVYYDPVNGQIKTSTDGISWTIRADGLNQNGTLGVDALGKCWYKQDTAVSYYAPAGQPTAWNRVIHPNQTSQINGMAWGVGTGGARWVTVGNTGYIMSSPDGFTWTERTSTFTAGNNFVSNTINTVVFANGRFLAVGGAGTVAYSLDGDNWVRVAYNGSPVITNANIKSITYGAGLYVVGNDSGFIYTSPDLTTWTKRTTEMDSVQAVNEIQFANGLFVAVYNAGFIYSSTDGITWTKRSQLTTTAYSAGGTFKDQYVTNNLYGVAYGNGLWVAAGASGVTLRSTDGLDWRTGVKTAALYQSANTWRVRYLRDRFWLYGDNGYLAWTTDGEIFWQVSSGHSVAIVRDGATDGTQVMSVGGNGQITFAYTQPGQLTNDYNTWSSHNIVFSPGTQYQGAMVNGLYIFMNDQGIWRTYDFMEYLPYVHNRISQNNRLSDVVGGNGMFVARSEGTNYVYFSPDGNRWCSIRKYSRNVDSRCTEHALSFEEGYFWKYYTGQYSIQRSNDGITWHTYYTFPFAQLPNSRNPQRIKRTGGTWFAYDPSTSCDSRYMYNHDLLRSPRNWRQGYMGVGGQGIFDIAMTDDFMVAACTDVLRASYNASGIDSMYIRNGNSNGTAGVYYKLWDIGGKMYGVQTDSYIREIVSTLGGSVTTTASTVYLGQANYTTQIADNSSQYSFRKSGNTVIGFYSNDPIVFDAGIPVTFSIYSSTLATVN